MKKQLTTILLTILALSCTAQEPRPMYSVEYVDSLNNVISTLKENSLIIPNLINSDTLDIEIYGSEASIKVEKKSYNMKLTFIHGNNRIYINYLPDDLDLMVMDSTFTRISQHLDLRNTY